MCNLSSEQVHYQDALKSGSDLTEILNGLLTATSDPKERKPIRTAYFLALARCFMIKTCLGQIMGENATWPIAQHLSTLGYAKILSKGNAILSCFCYANRTDMART